jgi:sulfate transport system permease protein
LVSVPIGVLLAWVLERYRFPGRRLLDAAIDLPFALPTAVAGIALTSLYLPEGWVGRLFAVVGIGVAYTPLGIGVALLFVGLPFIVRTVQPVLAGLDRSADEAALVLGASPGQIFRRVVLPVLMPAIVTGAALAFARAVGEYGSVIFIAGNRPMVSEILPLLIVTRLEQFDYPGAALLGAAMLVLSLAMLLVLEVLRRRGTRDA